MLVDTNTFVAMTEANQNFSKVVRIVDDAGLAVILKNNKPKYIVVDFDEYDAIKSMLEMRKKNIDSVANDLLEENMEALRELAK